MDRKCILGKVIIITSALLVLFVNASCTEVNKPEKGGNMKEAKGNELQKERAKIVALAQQGNKEAVINSAKTYLIIDPANIEIILTLAETYLSLENFNNAIETVNKALEVAPDNTWALKTSAKIHRMKADATISPVEKQKLLDFAQAKAEKALKLTPQDPLCLAEVAAVYSAQGKKKEALELIGKASVLDPGDPYTQTIKSRIEANP